MVLNATTMYNLSGEGTWDAKTNQWHSGMQENVEKPPNSATISIEKII